MLCLYSPSLLADGKFSASLEKIGIRLDRNLTTCITARLITYIKSGLRLLSIVSRFDLTSEMKTNKRCHAGYASAMQQTCLNVGEFIIKIF
jgi:hypothetical protein